MGLSDPGLGGWVSMLGRDNKGAGHLKQHVHRHTKGNGDLGNHERTQTSREYHSWGGGVILNLNQSYKPFLYEPFDMLCDHFISTPWQFNFLGYFSPYCIVRYNARISLFNNHILAAGQSRAYEHIRKIRRTFLNSSKYETCLAQDQL